MARRGAWLVGSGVQHQAEDGLGTSLPLRHLSTSVPPGWVGWGSAGLLAEELLG